MSRADETSSETRPRLGPKRNWLRFGIRALLVVMLLVACLAGWGANRVHHARLEDQAISDLRAAHGGSLNLIVANPYRRVDGDGEMEMFFAGGPAWLRDILGVDVFRTVIRLTCYAPGNSFHYDNVDENGKVTIRREYRAGVTDEQMELIANLRNLEYLQIEASPLGDAGAAHLSRLTELRTLNLSTTAITNQAITAIAKLPKLENLDISRTEVGDKALTQLVQLGSLKNLNVEITKATAEGIAAFRQARPDCVVVD